MFGILIEVGCSFQRVKVGFRVTYPHRRSRGRRARASRRKYLLLLQTGNIRVVGAGTGVAAVRRFGGAKLPLDLLYLLLDTTDSTGSPCCPRFGGGRVGGLGRERHQRMGNTVEGTKGTEHAAVCDNCR